MSGYTMTTPCDACPFLRTAVMLLTPGRIREIARAVAPRDGQGREFHCHKTTEVGGAKGGAEIQCAGALIYCEKQDRSTQLMRICERIGMYDRTQLASPELVWNNVNDWLAGGAC